MSCILRSREKLFQHTKGFKNNTYSHPFPPSFMARCHTYGIRYVQASKGRLLFSFFPSFACFQLPAGLKLQMFIEQSQYIAELSHTAGARVVIHDQGQMPFPDNEGNDVLPSRSTSFAIRKVSLDKRN